MPPEGGGLFIVGGVGVDGDVDFHDDSDADDPVERGVFDLPPNGHVCEDDDSTCSDSHIERSKFHEPKHH